MPERPLTSKADGGPVSVTTKLRVLRPATKSAEDAENGVSDWKLVTVVICRSWAIRWPFRNTEA